MKMSKDEDGQSFSPVDQRKAVADKDKRTKSQRATAEDKIEEKLLLQLSVLT